MNRAIRVILAAWLVGIAAAGCGSEGEAQVTVERLPDVQPSLPEVPTLPPPPHPVQHPDNSYSVYGLRKRIRNTIDSDVEVTGYIAQIYVPPECPQGEQCPLPAAPHFWIADTREEADASKRVLVAGYAENQAMIDEAVEQARRGRYEPPPPESGLTPIPTDLAAGNKIKLQGRFTRMSGSGFNVSEGMIEYRGHTTLEAVSPPAEE